MRIGKRLACDKCGRVESPKITVDPYSTDPDKHICNVCRNTSPSNALSALVKKESHSSSQRRSY